MVFGIIRIVNAAPNRVVTKTIGSDVMINSVEPGDVPTATLTNDIKNNSDIYAIAEDITKLIIELIFILFAILATFALFRYVKAKYAAVPTREQSSKS